MGSEWRVNSTILSHFYSIACPSEQWLCVCVCVCVRVCLLDITKTGLAQGYALYIYFAVQ